MKYERSRTGPPRSSTKLRSCATSPGRSGSATSRGWPTGSASASAPMPSSLRSFARSAASTWNSSVLAATLHTRAAIAESNCHRSSSRPPCNGNGQTRSRHRHGRRPAPSRAAPQWACAGREVVVYSCPFARYERGRCADLGITTTWSPCTSRSRRLSAASTEDRSWSTSNPSMVASR